MFLLQAKNVDVFRAVAQPLVAPALRGVSGTVFAYGVTSSGVCVCAWLAVGLGLCSPGGVACDLYLFRGDCAEGQGAWGFSNPSLTQSQG